MPLVSANGIEIYYEMDGDRQDPPVLLIHGLGGQLVDFDEAIDGLAGEGLFVIRVDLRDSGLSTHFRELGVPDISSILEGRHDLAPYRLSDMAADLEEVLDVAGVPSVHVVGVSMGAMVAQQFSILFPHRVRSLSSLLGTTGASRVGYPHPEILTLMLDPDTQWDSISLTAARSRVPEEVEGLVRRMKRLDERSVDPDAASRQLAAILASGERTQELAGVSVPALVVHGDADPLVDVSGGIATFQALPSARLLLLGGVGHDLSPLTWPRVRAELVRLIARVESSVSR
ncbi:MAG: alpha/beta fold hydrolase [Ferrimicrobium sp.]